MADPFLDNFQETLFWEFWGQFLFWMGKIRDFPEITDIFKTSFYNTFDQNHAKVLQFWNFWDILLFVAKHSRLFGNFFPNEKGSACLSFVPRSNCLSLVPLFLFNSLATLVRHFGCHIFEKRWHREARHKNDVYYRIMSLVTNFRGQSKCLQTPKLSIRNHTCCKKYYS